MRAEGLGVANQDPTPGFSFKMYSAIAPHPSAYPSPRKLAMYWKSWGEDLQWSSSRLDQGHPLVPWGTEGRRPVRGRHGEGTSAMCTTPRRVHAGRTAWSMELEGPVDAAPEAPPQSS